MRTANTALERSDALERTAEQARQALAHAEAMAGAESVRSAAMASMSGLGLDVTTVNVMGVRVPHIEQKRVARSALERGYSIVGASTSIDEAASAFEAEVEAIIQLAEVEIVAAYADVLQVGARNMHNTRLLRALSKVSRPVLLKRNFSATLNELLMSAEYILSGGNPDVILCERGIRTSGRRTGSTPRPNSRVHREGQRGLPHDRLARDADGLE